MSDIQYGKYGSLQVRQNSVSDLRVWSLIHLEESVHVLIINTITGTPVTCYLLSFGNLVVILVHFLLKENIKRGSQGINIIILSRECWVHIFCFHLTVHTCSDIVYLSHDWNRIYFFLIIQCLYIFKTKVNKLKIKCPFYQ
jgi:hypothetical protein